MAHLEPQCQTPGELGLGHLVMDGWVKQSRVRMFQILGATSVLKKKSQGTKIEVLNSKTKGWMPAVRFERTHPFG